MLVMQQEGGHVEADAPGTDDRDPVARLHPARQQVGIAHHLGVADADRKSTRLNSSHSQISYYTFFLMIRRPPISPLFPYTPLSRSHRCPRPGGPLAPGPTAGRHSSPPWGG